MIARVKCFVVGHDWTCKANEGIPPNQDELELGMLGFHIYACGYCARCGMLLPPGRKAIERAHRERLEELQAEQLPEIQA